MQANFGERVHLDQARAILDSNSEEASGEKKKHPGEWELGWKKINGRGGREFLPSFPNSPPTFPLFENQHGGESTWSRHILEHTEKRLHCRLLPRRRVAKVFYATRDLKITNVIREGDQISRVTRDRRS